MAGELGVTLARRLVELGSLRETDTDFLLTEQGAATLDAIGVDIERARRQRRTFARRCLDWSEHSPHLAGALGAALATRMLELTWVRRYPEGRALIVTPTGREALANAFSLSLPAFDDGDN